MLGAKMLDNYGQVPLTDYLGLGIVLFSYAGKLCWGFNADWDLLPDLHDFVDRGRGRVSRAAAGRGRADLTCGSRGRSEARAERARPPRPRLTPRHTACAFAARLPAPNRAPIAGSYESVDETHNVTSSVTRRHHR